MPVRASVTTAIRFPPEIHARLRAEAAARQLSINYLVVKAVEDFLPRLVPTEEWSLTRVPSPWPSPHPHQRSGCPCHREPAA